MQREYMTITEAAAALDVSTTTIWRRVKSGELEVFRSQADRRQRLVRRSDVEAMMRPAALVSKALAA